VSIIKNFPTSGWFRRCEPLVLFLHANAFLIPKPGVPFAFILLFFYNFRGNRGLQMITFNSVVVSVFLVLALCLYHVNVVIALTASAIVGGLVDGFSLGESVRIFSDGLGGGAKIALSYAILGAFASAVAHSGLSDSFANGIVGSLKRRSMAGRSVFAAKCIFFFIVGFVALACKNVVPVHIAFVPILIPPLLGIFNVMEIDRRAVACIITCGVILAYMLIPIGFGEIFLDNILLHCLGINGLQMTLGEAISALKFPAIGMVCGLALAVLRYRHPRKYKVSIGGTSVSRGNAAPPKRHVLVSAQAIVAALAVQLITGEIILSALAGFAVFSCYGVVCRRESNCVVVDGFKMMATIAFTMLAAAGFGNVMRASAGIYSLVEWLALHIGDNKALAICGMMSVGFLISIGIGSSFSTVPIVASVYVPLCAKLGIGSMATAVVVAISGVCGDAGSPASDSTLGPTMGLNADGQHDHIADTVIPAFLHVALPAFLCGIVSAIAL
jgi:predicted histidine transporter YuiF (NhaC family)